MTDWLPALWLAPGVWLAWRQRGLADRPWQHLVPLLLGPVILMVAGMAWGSFYVTRRGREWLREDRRQRRG